MRKTAANGTTIVVEKEVEDEPGERVKQKITREEEAFTYFTAES